MRTKAQEIEMCRDWVAHLPRNSYLADIMADVPAEVEQMISSDLGFGIGRELRNRQEQGREILANLRSEVREEEAKLREAKNELSSIEQRARAMHAIVDKIRKEAQEIARS